VIVALGHHGITVFWFVGELVWNGRVWAPWFLVGGVA
jgi:hypothetical protein